MCRLIQGLLIVIALSTFAWAGDEDEKEDSVLEGQEEENLHKMYNDMIRKYLIEYIQFQNMQSDSDKESMETVKQLIVQSWIYSLSPEKELVDDIITVDKKKTLEETREDLKQKIKTKKEAHVADDFIQFFDSIAGKLRNKLENDANLLEDRYEALENKIKKEEDSDKKKELEAEMNDIIGKYKEADILASVHDTAFKMAVQSFVLDLIDDNEQITTFVMAAGPSKKRTFDVPTLKKGDFDGFLGDDSEEDEDDISTIRATQ